jgi:guanine deaminase
MTEADFMRQAIAAARRGIAAGQTPFGAVVVRDGVVLAEAHNTVWRDTDPTAHAEVNAIREAARRLRTIVLDDCDMFTTCEPCPMCLAAIHWSKLRRVVYGAGIADAKAAGFAELELPARELAIKGGSRVRVECNVCEDECRDLFRCWKDAGLCPGY